MTPEEQPAPEEGAAGSGAGEIDFATVRAGLLLMALRGLGDRDAAEDAVQEVLARVLAAQAGSEPPRNPVAYAHGIARNVIADEQRRRGRFARAPSGADPPARGPDALLAIVTEEERDAVVAALSRLSAADREILRLSYDEGLTPVEIASRLGEPPERIRKRKQRALERLRRAFLGEDAGPSRSGPGSDMDDAPD